MIHVLVTGGNGQLAKCIQDLESQYSNLNIIYKSSSDLDITKRDDIAAFYEKHPIDYCINCAAYTAVDKAESEPEKAYAVNVLGAKNLAEVCSEYHACLIHISTDFVFDGNQSFAYTEIDSTNPTGVYGLTKLEGEQEIVGRIKSYFIIRTSWLYSEHGYNFMKTMIKLSESRDELSVVGDQIGTPTYAVDLADTILKIIESGNAQYGIYHYSNAGVASWYDFSKAIFEERKIAIKVSPINSDAYPTPAKRPHFSVLNKTKIKTNLQIEIPYWRDRLKVALSKLQG